MIGKPRILPLVLCFNGLAIVVALVWGWLEGHIGKHFYKEVGLLTAVSFLQLLILSLLAVLIFRAAQGRVSLAVWRSPKIVWLLFAIGFLYLAIDEVAMGHERIDDMIHHLLAIQETALSDRLDDLIVGLYGLVGAAIIYVYRAEFTASPGVLRLLIFGLILAGLSVGLDLLSNRGVTNEGDWVTLLFGDYVDPTWLRRRLAMAEEVCKVFAEGLFVAAFFSRLGQVRAVSTIETAKRDTPARRAGLDQAPSADRL